MEKTTEAPPVRSLTELDQLVDSGEITEAELAQYFIQNESAPGNLEPVFSLNEALIEIDPKAAELESALMLNFANGWARRIRKRQYKRRLKTAGSDVIKIVAEGDSWFQYPFILHDVIDHLMDQPNLAVRCYSEAGDILSNILAKSEFLKGIQKEQPEVFLISGGGNDLVDGAGLRRFLLPFKEGREPKDYFRPEYTGFKATIGDSYVELFRNVLAEAPDIKILCHGYSYPIPNNGPWLGKPMASIGIEDRDLQREIMRLIVDDINDVISGAATAVGNNTRFMDVKKVVPKDGWHDEFHPTSDWFGEVTEPFLASI